MKNPTALFLLFLILPSAFLMPVYAHPDASEPAKTPSAPHRAAVVKGPADGRVISVAGDKSRLLIGGAENGGKYALFDYIAPPGGGPPSHIHSREDEAFYILEGQFNFQSNGETISAGPGTFIHSPRGSLHAFVNTGDKPGRLLIWVMPAGLENFFEEVGSPLPDRNAPAAAFTMEAAQKLNAAASQYGLEIKAPEVTRSEQKS